MTNNTLSRRQLRKLLNEEANLVNESFHKACLLKEERLLVEFWDVVLKSAIPFALKHKGTAINWGKKLLGWGSTAMKHGKDYMPAVQKGLTTAKDASSVVNAYKGMGREAKSIGDDLFGGKGRAYEVGQAIETMGPDITKIGDSGIQSIFGKNDPNRMAMMSREINQGNLGDAAMLYGAMKGMGTKEDVVKTIITKRKGNLTQLTQEFANFIKLHPDEEDESLSYWLLGDGMRDEANLVNAEMGSADAGAGAHGITQPTQISGHGIAPGQPMSPDQWATAGKPTTFKMPTL